MKARESVDGKGRRRRMVEQTGRESCESARLT